MLKTQASKSNKDLIHFMKTKATAAQVCFIKLMGGRFRSNSQLYPSMRLTHK